MLPKRLRILYLHGFASGPASRKARFFAERLAEDGCPLQAPALDESDFENLTIGGQLDLLRRLLRNERAILIGSSLGGYLAALYAARHPEIDRLVLLAPAFDFFQLWRDELGPQRLEAWRQNGTLPVFHYAQNREVPLAYGFFQDASRFDPFPEFRQPTLLFHGNQDAVVPVQSSILFAQRHPNTRLVRLDSEHDLTDALEQIWLEMRPF
ncbi:MAG: alpha/beta hydrolase, partial [Bryobacteraceae bacterium]